MKIETKFNIGDLVSQHITRNGVKRRISFLEVMEIQTQSCYAGTQVFYLCRIHVAEKQFQHKIDEFSEDKKENFKWEVHHRVGSSDATTGWHKYREDELLRAGEDVTDIISSQVGAPSE